MKKLIPFVALVFLSSCEIYFFDEQYPVWDDRDQFVGSYKAEEYSNTTEQFYTYTITIQKSCCNSHDVIITNFYGAGLDIVANVYDTKLTIPLQRINDYEVEGTGKLKYDRLTINFVVRDFYERPVFTDFAELNAWLY